MNRLTHHRENGIKEGYWSPATKEELVQRLAMYENTGLEPEEIAPEEATNPSAWMVGKTSVYMIYRMKDKDKPDVFKNRQHVSVDFHYKVDALDYAQYLNERAGLL